MQKILLYFVLSIICIIYLSLCKGILPHKDLHSPTEISVERQDISGKKTSYTSHQLADSSNSSWWARNLVKALKEGTRREPWQPVSSNFKSGHTNCHTDLIFKLIKKQNPVLEMWPKPSVNLRLCDSHCRMRQNVSFCDATTGLPWNNVCGTNIETSY